MDNGTPEQEKKPFSILERFRQLKKTAEQSPPPGSSSGDSNSSPANVGTVLKGSTSSDTPKGGKFGKERTSRFKRKTQDGGPENLGKHKPQEMHIGQKEEDVGITEFLRKGPGFDVIIKHRHTDFQVNEINREGKVVVLTSTEVPKEEETLVTDEVDEPSCLTPEQWAKVKEIVEEKLDTTVDIDVTDLDKDERQKIHKSLKKRFGVHIFSNTVDVKDRKVLKIGFSLSESSFRFVRWPSERPPFLHFVVVKKNMEMGEVIAVLSKITKVNQSKFGYAGTKDKRSVSTQQMSVQRVNAERLCCIQDKLRGMATGNYSYKWKGLRLGDLSGNRFKIALRNIKASDEVIHEAVEEFETTGFINYFGLQRFGQSVLVPTYLVGKAILKGDWELAVELILKPRPGEVCFHDVMQAREVWWTTRDPRLALKALSRKDQTIEGKILIGLYKNGPRAFQNAFDNVPRQSVCMYLHSYQSLIWNKVVSRRVKEFGLKVLVGDLVKVQQQVPWEAREEEEESDESDDEEKPLREEVEPRLQVRALTEEEARSTSIYDVLYPMPGDDISLPNNAVRDWYTQLLADDGFTLQTFGQVNRKYGMYGAYRNMLARAENISWRTLQHSSPEDDLLPCDLDRLRGRSPPNRHPEGPYKALIIEFNLASCSYATMALRELAKCETSTSSQAKLTNQLIQEHQDSKRAEGGEGDHSKKMKTEDTPATDTAEEAGNGSVDCAVETNHMEQMEVESERETDVMREAKAENLINKYLEETYH